MQPISSYNDNLGIALLLVGGAGAGKTSLGMRLFPKTYVLASDPNLASGIRYLKKIGQLDNVVGFDNLNVYDDGKPVPVNMRYDRMISLLDKAIADPNIDCIFRDSVTFMEDIIKAKICGAQNEATIKLQNFEQWGNYLMTWKYLVSKCRASGKKLIDSAHENKEKDESDGIFKYQILVDGQIRNRFPAIFSDVIRCEVQETNGKYQWMARCLPNVRQEHLKNTFGIEGVITQDELVKRVREQVK